MRRKVILLFTTVSICVTDWAKSITRFDDRSAEEKLSKSGVWANFQMEVPLFFGNTPSSHTKTQLDSFSRFDGTPTCDKQLQTDGPRAMAWLVPAVAQRRAGKNAAGAGRTDRFGGAVVVVGPADGYAARLEVSTSVMALHRVFALVTLDALTLPIHKVTATSPSLWSRYDRHFVGVTQYNALS